MAGMTGSIVSLAEGRRRCCTSGSYPKFHIPGDRSLVPERIWEGLQKEHIANKNTSKIEKKKDQIRTPGTLFNEKPWQQILQAKNKAIH